jgi:hypothetical protein
MKLTKDDSCVVQKLMKWIERLLISLISSNKGKHWA